MSTEPSAKIHAIRPPVMPPEAAFDRDESDKSILTELDLHGLESGARIRVRAGVRLTPSAADVVRQRGLQLVERVARSRDGQAKPRPRCVAIGADHGGFAAKEALKEFLVELGQTVLDFGTDSAEAVDYPDFAAAVARAVAEGRAEVGVMIDGAGIGSAMAANKVRGVRAAACYSVALAKNSREHNGANVLTLGSAMTSVEEMRDILRTWLVAELTEPRHQRRVQKIESLERH